MTDLTLLFIFGPAILISLFFLLFIRSRIYGGISRTLLMILWVNAFMVLLWLTTSSYSTSASPQDMWVGSAQGVTGGVLLAQLALSVFQSGAYILEELLLWGFVAFFAVIIGSIYLTITIWRKKGGSLAEKMSEVSFKGNLQNPLTAGFDMMGVQTYLIIGLVTMPSMLSILMGMEIAGLSLFALSVIYDVLLFYRFSLMAYTRIAKKTDLHYGKEDLGQRYQQRMIGWFTILNLLLSIGLLGYSLYSVGPSAIDYVAGGLVVELRSLLIAILVLPFVEGFAAVFFERFWRFWARLGTRIRGINWRSASYSLFRGVIVGGACFILFYSIISFVTGATTFFAVNGGNPALQPIFNNQIGAVDIYGFTQKTLNYDQLVLPTLWALVGVFLFQFIKVLIGGSLTHRSGVAPEYSIIVAAITITALIWVLAPAMNFLLGAFPAYLATDAQTFVTYTLALVPQPLQQQYYTVYYIIPAPSELLYILFLDIPVWIFGSLLLTYFFIYRRELIPRKKGEGGVFTSSDFVKLFTSFCIVVLASLGTLTLMNPTSELGQLANGLLTKLWFPNASELWLFQVIGSSWVFFHNMIRFLLTVFGPLILWVSVVGIWKWFQDEKVKGKLWYLLGVLVLALEGIFFIDRFTYVALIGIPLVGAALYRVFYRLIRRTKPKTIFRTTFLKISFYSLILCEIYSTAIAIADRFIFQGFAAGGNLGLLSYLLELIPHSLIEIPAAILAAMIGLYIARRMISKIDEDEKKLSKFMDEGKKLIQSSKIWYPILFVTVFFAVAAVIEIYVSWGPMTQLANMFGFA